MSFETPSQSLSPAGKRRRDEILGLAVQQLEERGRRRRQRRALGASLALALVAFALVLEQRWADPASRTSPTRPTVARNEPAPRLPTAESLGYPFELIDDAQLVTELHAAGIEVGVVRVQQEPPRLVAGDGKPYEPPLVLKPTT
ncbi:MAG: hypothetical protein U0572_05560 [Phycisphaerales bacterium]